MDAAGLDGRVHRHGHGHGHDRLWCVLCDACCCLLLLFVAIVVCFVCVVLYLVRFMDRARLGIHDISK